jgi:hypothetical protein
MRAIVLTLFAVAATPLAAQAEKDPLRDLLKSERDGLCYRRDYDAAHLRRHPRQATQSVVLSFRKDATRITFRQHGRDHYVVAGCDYHERAGYDSSGNLVVKGYKGPGGYNCIVIISVESAREGGGAVLDLAGGDGSTLTLLADSPMKARLKPDMKGRVIDLKLGAADREFRLARADAAACRAMDRGLKGF